MSIVQPPKTATPSNTTFTISVDFKQRKKKRRRKYRKHHICWEYIDIRWPIAMNVAHNNILYAFDFDIWAILDFDYTCVCVYFASFVFFFLVFLSLIKNEKPFFVAVTSSYDDFFLLCFFSRTKLSILFYFFSEKGTKILENLYYIFFALLCVEKDQLGRCNGIIELLLEYIIIETTT